MSHLSKLKRNFGYAGSGFFFYKTLKTLEKQLSKIGAIDSYFRKKSISKLDNYSEIKKWPTHWPEIDETVIEAYAFNGYGQYQSIRPFQYPSEIIEFAEYVKEEDPKNVVEIGTAKGGTLYVWTQVLDAKQYISINLPEGYSKGRSQFYQNFSSKEINCIRKNSHKEETKEKLREKLDGEEIDFLFIDGDHSYEGVKEDFEMYKDLVSEDGIIAFHDILKLPENPDNNVEKFWKEIKDKFKSKEIVAGEPKGRAGIGIIRVN